jgi:PiT family inorganic phosphate transporter
VVLSAGLSIALGTYMGGWPIIRTPGKRVSDIHPVQGFAGETTSAARWPSGVEVDAEAGPVVPGGVLGLPESRPAAG